MTSRDRREQPYRGKTPIRTGEVIPSPFPSESLPVRRDVPEGEMPSDGKQEPVQGLYIISVAARLLAMHPQTLRKYERAGLIHPPRTIGKLRLYSEQDIARLKLIKHLVDDLGMNLAGVELVLDLLSRISQARQRIAALEAQRDFRRVVTQEFDRMLQLLDVAMDNLDLPKEME